MPNQHATAESALVSPGWVEAHLGISRQTRLDLEERGALTPIRLTENSHRRYRRAEVVALAEGGHTSPGNAVSEPGARPLDSTGVSGDGA